jgi:unsaturated chondroitin disaccharide hydrolase
MNRLLLFIALISSFSIAFMGCSHQQMPIRDLAARQLSLAARQYDKMAAFAADSVKLPRSFAANGKHVFAPSSWWTSGFIPGSLWYLAEYDAKPGRKESAKTFTQKVEKEQYNIGTHDLGFMLYCSYGNGYRLCKDPAYRAVLLTGARSLCTRFNEKIGCIQSWDRQPKWQYPVIIDNMMNLELLMWAFKETGDSTFAHICIRHADKTIKNHYRKDYSSYHVVSYDTLTGGVQVKATHQGYSDESAWARGQVWGLYGFTMLHRETGLKRYLDQAVHIADFLIHHPNMPVDGIPYWDFNAPGIPNEERDSSAGAIMASALLELCTMVDAPVGQTYRAFAEKQIRTLSSQEYFAEPGTNGFFLIKHGVGHKPGKSEIDVPLTYGDYYYIEALMRLRK